MRNIVEVFTNYGFFVQKESDGWNISKYTPAGEDWWFCLNKLEDIKDYAENFNPEEEFEVWVEAKKNGEKGIPPYGELWQDQIWKQNMLKNVANEV